MLKFLSRCLTPNLLKPTNSWVAQQQKEAPNALWASGARSYCEHAAGLAKEFGDILSTANGGDGEGGDKQPSAKKAKPAAPAATAAAAAPPPSAFGGGLFGGFGGGGTTAGTATFNFGSAAAAAPAAAPPAATSSLFGAPPPATGASLFGAPPTGTFNFGGGAAAAPATGGFGFGFGGPGGAAAAAAADDDDGAEEEAEETETVLDGGATILFKEKAKLHTQGPDKKWVDRGAGVLTVRAPAGGGEGGEGAASASSSRRPYLVFTTDSGRVLLNAACYRGLAAMKARKPHMVTASLANAAAGGESGGAGGGGAAAPQISPTLFNLFAEGAADKFVAVLKEAASK